MTANNPNETFVGKTTNISNRQSASGSLIERWQLDGADVVSIRKTALVVPGGASNACSISENGNGHGIFINSSAVGFSTNDGYGLRAGMLVSKYNIMVQKTFVIGWHATGAPTDQNGGDTSIGRSAAGVVSISNDVSVRNIIGTGNLATGTVTKSADYTATTSDGTIEVDASGAARTITLFACSGNAGKIIVVKKTDSSGNAVTVDGNASETIDGATTISLASQYSTAILQVNAAGTGWNKLGGV